MSVFNYNNAKIITMQKENSKKNIGVYLGRFQPLHNAHLEIILSGLQKEDHFIVILGSASKFDDKNPFSPETRERFVVESVKEYDSNLLDKLSVVKLYAKEVPEIWYPTIDALILAAINKSFSDNVSVETITAKYNLYLYGSGKDASTIKCSTGVKNNTILKVDKFIEPVLYGDYMLNSTDIRKKLSKNPNTETETMNDLKKYLPNAVIKILMDNKLLTHYTY